MNGARWRSDFRSPSIRQTLRDAWRYPDRASWSGVLLVGHPQQAHDLGVDLGPYLKTIPCAWAAQGRRACRRRAAPDLVEFGGQRGIPVVGQRSLKLGVVDPAEGQRRQLVQAEPADLERL